MILRTVQCGAEDRRRHQPDPADFRPDQPARAQRHHRGGAGRRSRPRLRGGRLRGEIARPANRQGDRGRLRADLGGAGLHQGRDRRRRQHREVHRGHQPAIPPRSRDRSRSRAPRRSTSPTTSPMPRRRPARSPPSWARSPTPRSRPGRRRRSCCRPRNRWRARSTICAARSRRSSVTSRPRPGVSLPAASPFIAAHRNLLLLRHARHRAGH